MGEEEARKKLSRLGNCDYRRERAVAHPDFTLPNVTASEKQVGIFEGLGARASERNGQEGASPSTAQHPLLEPLDQRYLEG